jgi:hypothetical protein
MMYQWPPKPDSSSTQSVGSPTPYDPEGVSTGLGLLMISCEPLARPPPT